MADSKFFKARTNGVGIICMVWVERKTGKVPKGDNREGRKECSDVTHSYHIPLRCL